MPMSRYQIRNEYSLADPELYGVADKDDPEALLEAVAMAGLVGVLRQLGDLAEFAAEVFHDLHEEVMATATRGHGLMVRVKQLEAEFPLIEKAFLSQTSPSPFFSSTGTDWHPSLHTNQNLITGGDLPRFIMDSYEECRGPPRLFLLDKFDVAGAGACLKRYTDPSFFKVEASSYGPSSAEVQKGKRSRKSKKKGSRLRNAGTPEVLPTSHAKLQQLFLEDRVENGVTDPARLVKLKRKLNGNPFDSKTGKSFMEKFIYTSSPEDKVVHEIAYGSSLLELPSKTTSESGAAASSLKETMIVEGIVLKPFVDEVSEDLSDREYSSRTNRYPFEVVDEKEIAVNGKSKTDGNKDGYQSDGVASEVENYVDALATMESEIETDTEFRTKYDIGFVDIEKQGTSYDANEELFQVQFSDSQSTGNSNASEEGNILVEKGSSSFSYSDTGSTAAENMPVDVDVAAKVSTSTKVCEAEVAVMSTEKVSTSEELSVSQDYHQPPKLDVSDDTSNEVNDMPSHGSESGESSSSLRRSDSFPTHIPLEEGEILARGTLRGPQMVKILSNHDELDTKFIKTEVNSITWGNNIPWTSRHPSIPSHTKDDEPPTDIASAENHILDKLDGDPGLLSSAPIHISENILEENPKKYDDESSLDDLLEAEHEKDSCTENLVDSQISQSHSVISHAEVNPSVLALLNSETTNTVLQPEVFGSVDNIFPSAKATTFDSNFVSDSSSNSSIAEQQGAERADEVPQIPIGSAVVSCHEEEIPNRSLLEADSGEMGEITRSISLIESEATGVEKNSDYLNSVGPRSFTGFPVPSKADDVKEGEISSGMNLDGIETTALVISLGSLKTTGLGLLIDEKQTEVDRSENITVAAIVANHDSDADKVDSTSKRNFPAEDSHRVQKPDQYGDEFLPQNYNESVKQTAMVNQEIASPDLDSVQCETAFADHSDSDKATEMSLQPVKATALSFSSIYNVQNTEPASSVESNFHVYSGDTLPTSTHHFPEVRTHSEPKLTIQTDQLDIEHLHVDESKSTEVSQSEQLRTHSEPKLTIQTDQLDIEQLHVDESKPTEVSLSEQLSCLDHLDEGSIDAHSEPCFVPSKPVVQVNIQADILAAESLYGDKASFGSSSKFVVNQMDHGGNVITSPRSSSVPPLSELSQPVSHEVDISPQAGDELSAVRSGIPLLPEVPQIDLADLPPLPPLPPVQWRIGRAQQHSSQPSDRDPVNTFGLFPPMFPSKTGNNTQMGYPTNKDDLLPPVPVLPPPAVKDEDLQHVYEHFLDSTAHTGPLSMQIPPTSNNRSRNVPTSESTSNTDPCLTLSYTGNEIPGHGMHAGEAGSMQSSFTPSSTVITSVDASFLIGSVPSYPLSQMQPEVCLEPETTSIRSEVRLIKFPDTNVPQPTVADEHPKDASTTSDGEAVWSTSNSLYPALEDGTLNGNRQMKLPRPRSPLIDAVAAHNKSMLRKVTERSRPEVPKVEERDSLLEQIRAKSFNLKPAVVTRPSIQGPKTNLRVAAILEKANAIRQALAGSDEDDDDDDSWSDE